MDGCAAIKINISIEEYTNGEHLPAIDEMLVRHADEALENANPEPNSRMGQLLLNGENLCRFYAMNYSLKASILRIPFTYGPNEKNSFFYKLVQKIKESSTFQEGMATLRQISFGFLDMSWHGVDPSGVKDVKKHETKAFEGTTLYPETAETCMSVSFSHIFQGGYSSGYYSYKWAEVLDADAFAYFKEKGIFNSEVATKFKENVLSKGGTDKPMVLYERFRGAKPKVEALLERAGLIEKVD